MPRVSSMWACPPFICSSSCLCPSSSFIPTVGSLAPACASHGDLPLALVSWVVCSELSASAAPTTTNFMLGIQPVATSLLSFFLVEHVFGSFMCPVGTFLFMGTASVLPHHTAGSRVFLEPSA